MCIRDRLWTIDSLCRGPRKIFQSALNIPKRHRRGMNFGPLIGGTPAHAVNFFSEQRFPVTRIKIDFPQNFEILIPGSGPRYSHQNFFHDALGSPYNESKKLAPTPDNLAKMGCKFFGVEQFQFHGGKILGVV